MEYKIKFEGTVNLEPVGRPVASDLIQRHLDYDPLVYFPADEGRGETVVVNHGSLAGADILHKSAQMAGITQGPDDRPAPLYALASGDVTKLHSADLAEVLDLTNASVGVHFRVDKLTTTRARAVIYRIYADDRNNMAISVSANGVLRLQWMLDGMGGSDDGERAYIDLPADSIGLELGRWHHLLLSFNSKFGEMVARFDAMPVATGVCGDWTSNKLVHNSTNLGAEQFDTPDDALDGSIAHFGIFPSVLGDNAARNLSGR